MPQNLDATAKTDHETEADNGRANFVYKVYSEMNLSTASELTSSSEFEFLSSTDPSEAGLSEREIRKRTDPDLPLQCTGKLFAAFPGIRDTKISLLVRGMLVCGIRDK